MLSSSVYVGLSDSETHDQLFTTEEYINTLRNVCRHYQVEFSFNVIQGGYVYDNGEYSEETTLHIRFIDLEENIVNEIAEDLCTFFKQESVMIIQSEVKKYYITGDSEVKDVLSSI